MAVSTSSSNAAANRPKEREEAEALLAARRRQEEAAAKHNQEEAALAAKRLLSKFAVLRTKVLGRTLVLTLRVSTAGVVSVSGSPLKKVSQSLAAGVRRLSVTIAGGARGGHRHAVRVTVSLRTAAGIVSRALTLKLL